MLSDFKCMRCVAAAAAAAAAAALLPHHVQSTSPATPRRRSMQH
jgi:hypothetical protein